MDRLKYMQYKPWSAGKSPFLIHKQQVDLSYKDACMDSCFTKLEVCYIFK